jgi:signal transduction histidine kinase
MPWNPNNQSRVVGLVIAGIIGALVAGALVLSSVRKTESALDDAAALHSADLTLSAQNTAMATIGQAVLLAEDLAIGVAQTGDVDAASAVAAESVATVEMLFSSLPAADQVLQSAFSAWEAAASNVIGAVSGDDPRLAAGELAESLAPASVAFATELSSQRDGLVAAVEDADGSAGFLSRLAGFLVVFLLPLAAILVYRISARRQLDVAVGHLDTRVAAEQQDAEQKKRFVVDFANDLKPEVMSLRELAQRLTTRGGFLEIDETAKSIDAKSEQLMNRIEDLLVTAGDTEETPSPQATVTDMAEQINAVIQSFARSGHVIGGTYGQGDVDADDEKVRQILRNLLSNAVEHGGSDIRLYGDVAGSSYVVSVEDDGPGLSEELADRLAASGANAASGTSGLGLDVASKLAVAMGGSLEYERVAGRTAFVVMLPAAIQSAPAEAGILVTADQ